MAHGIRPEILESSLDGYVRAVSPSKLRHCSVRGQRTTGRRNRNFHNFLDLDPMLLLVGGRGTSAARVITMQGPFRESVEVSY
jgi:hypothetical protein